MEREHELLSKVRYVLYTGRDLIEPLLIFEDPDQSLLSPIPPQQTRSTPQSKLSPVSNLRLPESEAKPLEVLRATQNHPPGGKGRYVYDKEDIEGTEARQQTTARGIDTVLGPSVPTSDEKGGTNPYSLPSGESPGEAKSFEEAAPSPAVPAPALHEQAQNSSFDATRMFDHSEMSMEVSPVELRKAARSDIMLIGDYLLEEEPPLSTFPVEAGGRSSTESIAEAEAGREASASEDEREEAQPVSHEPSSALMHAPEVASAPTLAETAARQLPATETSPLLAEDKEHITAENPIVPVSDQEILPIAEPISMPDGNNEGGELVDIPIASEGIPLSIEPIVPLEELASVPGEEGKGVSAEEQHGSVPRLEEVSFVSPEHTEEAKLDTPTATEGKNSPAASVDGALLPATEENDKDSAIGESFKEAKRTEEVGEEQNACGELAAAPDSVPVQERTSTDPFSPPGDNLPSPPEAVAEQTEDRKLSTEAREAVPQEEVMEDEQKSPSEQNRAGESLESQVKSEESAIQNPVENSLGESVLSQSVSLESQHEDSRAAEAEEAEKKSEKEEIAQVVSKTELPSESPVEATKLEEGREISQESEATERGAVQENTPPTPQAEEKERLLSEVESPQTILVKEDSALQTDQFPPEKAHAEDYGEEENSFEQTPPEVDESARSRDCEHRDERFAETGSEPAVFNTEPPTVQSEGASLAARPDMQPSEQRAGPSEDADSVEVAEQGASPGAGPTGERPVSADSCLPDPPAGAFHMNEEESEKLKASWQPADSPIEAEGVAEVLPQVETEKQPSPSETPQAADIFPINPIGSQVKPFATRSDEQTTPPAFPTNLNLFPEAQSDSPLVEVLAQTQHEETPKESGLYRETEPRDSPSLSVIEKGETKQQNPLIRKESDIAKVEPSTSPHQSEGLHVDSVENPGDISIRKAESPKKAQAPSKEVKVNVPITAPISLHPSNSANRPRDVESPSLNGKGATKPSLSPILFSRRDTPEDKKLHSEVHSPVVVSQRVPPCDIPHRQPTSSSSRKPAETRESPFDWPQVSSEFPEATSFPSPAGMSRPSSHSSVRSVLRSPGPFRRLVGSSQPSSNSENSFPMPTFDLPSIQPLPTSSQEESFRSLPNTVERRMERGGEHFLPPLPRIYPETQTQASYRLSEASERRSDIEDDAQLYSSLPHKHCNLLPAQDPNSVSLPRLHPLSLFPERKTKGGRQLSATVHAAFHSPESEARLLPSYLNLKTTWAGQYHPMLPVSNQHKSKRKQLQLRSRSQRNPYEAGWSQRVLKEFFHVKVTVSPFSSFPSASVEKLDGRVSSAQPPFSRTEKKQKRLKLSPE